MNNIQQDFTIRDLENISGIKAHTIRIWEKRYNLLHPKRTNTNIRYYSPENLLKLLNIVLLNKNNFKISKIAKMSNEELILHSRELALNSSNNDEAINAFMVSMFQFDKILFNKTYTNLLSSKSFREVFKDVFIPFLNQIGLLWQTDTLIPAHEHFISNLIAQKIQVNTEQLQYNITDEETIYVLFLPQNEIHELGLLYLNYELALRGKHTIYLGQSLPLDNLDFFFENNQHVCFITSLTIRPYDDKIESYFRKIETMLEGKEHQFIATGKRTELLKDVVFSSNIKFYSSIPDLLKVL